MKTDTKEQPAITPLPWKYFEGFIIASDGTTIADPRQMEPSEEAFKEMDANAAFIVRACNAHGELVKALGDVLLANAALREAGDPETHNPVEAANAIELAQGVLAAAEIVALDALKKATQP